jgi:hypothetical protein
MVIGAFVLMLSTAAAAVTFDPATGEGFVGKGDVQDVFGWNNRQLQENADDVEFRASSEVVTEVSWICTNTTNQNEQLRSRTTTTTVSGIVETVARERNQVTGFILEGYDGDPVVGDPETEGPPVDSCPSGPWTLTEKAGEPEVVDSTSVLQVSIDEGGTWHDIGGEE